MVTENGVLATRPTGDVEAFPMLDTYAAGIAPASSRIDAIATISAGYREAPKAAGELGIPRASRDGQIYIHDATGRAPGLAAALKAGEGKRLTIAFPLDDPRSFIQQRFAQYTASSLKAYGDDKSITVITPTFQHKTFEAGTDEYARVVADCKVSVSVYFALAEWTEAGPSVLFNDGLGLYRLRFTSRNSLRSIVSTLQFVGKLTKGRLAGIPFELALDYREVADPKGSKRTIPVWTITPKPPGGMRLNSRTFQPFIEQSLAQGAALLLPAPSAETIETALSEYPEPDLDEGLLAPTEAQVRQLAAGGLCDPAYWCSRWFAVAKQTPWAQAEARSAFIEQVTHGHFRSLKAYLAKATDRQASELLEELHSVVNRWSLGDERAVPDRLQASDLETADEDNQGVPPPAKFLPRLAERLAQRMADAEADNAVKARKLAGVETRRQLRGQLEERLRTFDRAAQALPLVRALIRREFATWDDLRYAEAAALADLLRPEAHGELELAAEELLAPVAAG